LNELLQHSGMAVLLGVLLLAFATSAIHGATGVAGGFLLSTAVAPIIGVALVVPVISIALLFSHGSRALFNLTDFDARSFFAITLPSLPCIVAMAFLYAQLSTSVIATTLGFILLLSIPLRRWAASHSIKTSTGTLGVVGAVYGVLSGVSIGPGMLLVPFLLGYGLRKEQFVATLAVIALVTNITRITVFGASDLLTTDYVWLGVVCGLATIPGNWFGRTVLRKISSARHAGAVDVLTVLGAVNFFWLAVG